MASARRERGKTCLVTVGTTQFEDLLDAIDSEEGAEALVSVLAARGFSRMVVQYGRGAREPAALEAAAAGKRLAFEAFRFSHEFGAFVEAADLVVSHAGAGSILEALRARKPLLVVVNERLQENHQVELASALQDQGYLHWARPGNAVAVLAEVLSGELRAPEPFPEADKKAFPRLIEEELGFSPRQR